jgi:histone deacetylase 6
VRSETDPQLSNWYKTNSLIYVSPDHACWNDEDVNRKVRKSRFGGVKRSEVEGLSAMMDVYLEESGKWVLSKVEELETRRRESGWVSETEEVERAEERWTVETGGEGKKFSAGEV